MAEYNGSNVLQHRYVFGPGSDEPIVQYDGTGTTSRNWLVADERGSIIAMTNGSGAVTHVDSYDEYGIPGTSNSGRFQYTGHDASASIIVSSRGKDAAEFLMNLYREDQGSAVLINTMPIVRDLSTGGKFDICATKYFSNLSDIARSRLSGKVLKSYLIFLQENCHRKP